MRWRRGMRADGRLLGGRRDQVLAPHALSAQADEARAEMAGTTLETHGLLLKGMRVWDSTTSKYTTKGGVSGCQGLLHCVSVCTA